MGGSAMSISAERCEDVVTVTATFLSVDDAESFFLSVAAGLKSGTLTIVTGTPVAVIEDGRALS